MSVGIKSRLCNDAPCGQFDRLHYSSVWVSEGGGWGALMNGRHTRKRLWGLWCGVCLLSHCGFCRTFLPLMLKTCFFPLVWTSIKTCMGFKWVDEEGEQVEDIYLHLHQYLARIWGLLHLCRFFPSITIVAKFL